jgi:hypothetical protein
MIATPKQKRVSTQKSKKNAISEPIPVPIPTPVVAEKPPSYRQKLIEKIGLEAVREKERLSRQATKERKAQAQADFVE